MESYVVTSSAKQLTHLLLGEPHCFPLHQHLDVYAGVGLIEHHLSLCIATYILLDYIHCAKCSRKITHFPLYCQTNCCEYGYLHTDSQHECFLGTAIEQQLKKIFCSQELLGMDRNYRKYFLERE